MKKVQYNKQEMEQVINVLNQLVVPVNVWKVIWQVIDFLIQWEIVEEEKDKKVLKNEKK